MFVVPHSQLNTLHKKKVFLPFFVFPSGSTSVFTSSWCNKSAGCFVQSSAVPTFRLLPSTYPLNSSPLQTCYVVPVNTRCYPLQSHSIRSGTCKATARPKACRSLHGNVKVKAKVKLFHCRPGQAQRGPGVWGSQISRQSAHEGGKVVSLRHRPPLPAPPPRKYFWYSFLLEAESTPEP